MAAVLAGEDPIDAIQNMVENFWYKVIQNVLFASVRGVIADNVNDNSDMILNLTAKAGEDAKISSTSIIQAIFLMGDKFQEITAMSMHCSVFSPRTE